jgi:hypothetical protein
MIISFRNCQPGRKLNQLFDYAHDVAGGLP